MSWSDSDDDMLLLQATQDVPKCDRTTSSSQKGAKTKAVIKVGTSVKKQSSWVSSSFDDFTSFGQDMGSQSGSQGQNKTKKRPREQSQSETKRRTSFTGATAVKNETHQLWADKHAPQNNAELAVHKKKIQELQDWLEHSFRARHREAPMLLLTGPSGTGKTACLQVVCKELKTEVQEWVNPVVAVYSERTTWDDSTSFAAVNMSRSESQASLFQDFLLRANKYPTLSIFNQDQLYRKLILVEDIPNAFFRDTSQFHEILRNYQKKGHCPLVFIVSDSVAGDSNERLLFPKHIQAEFNIANISFNPVAQTSLTKVLTRIASYEASRAENKGKLRVPDKATIDSLATSSNGDIRGAVNALQFACLKGSNQQHIVIPQRSKTQSQVSRTKSKLRDKFCGKKKAGCDKKGVDKSSHDLAAIGAKDTSLFLFRALGKILYCKRDDPSSYRSTTELPSHLSHHYRDPLQVDPEDVIEKSHLSSDFFIAYLHQNYPEFYNSIDDIVMSSSYLSDADYLTVDWASRSALKDYASSVAARGIMFSNTQRATHAGSTGSKLGWKPLHKPQWYDVCKKMRENSGSGKSLFAGQCTPIELQTVLVPYMAVINPHLHNTGKSYYIREVGRMSRYCRTHVEKLDEKDVTMLEGEDITHEQSLLAGGSNESENTGTPTSSFMSSNTEENNENEKETNIQADMDVVEEIENDDFVIEDFDD